MNRKHFQIFQEWRKKKHKIDLEKLENDFSFRGLFPSGMFKEGKEWLEEECRAEIEMKRQEMEEFESEKKQQLIKDIFLILIPILSLISVMYFNSKITVTSENINRPYLSLVDSNLEFTEPAIKSYRFNQFRFETYITNIGNLPARFIITNTNHVGYDEILWSPEEPIDGIIFPQQKIRLSWILSWDNDSESFLKWAKEEMNPAFLSVIEKIMLRVDYSFVNDNNYTYFTELQSELTRIRNGQIGTSEFSWKITNAR